MQQRLRPAPDLAIHIPGKPDIHLSRYKGRVVLLAFLNTGCTGCEHFSIEQLGPLQKEYGARGLQVLGVLFNKEAAAGLAKFESQFVRGFPIGLSDEATVLAWLKQPVEEGYFTPMIAFVDRHGNIESRYLGDDILFQDPGPNIRRKLNELLKR